MWLKHENTLFPLEGLKIERQTIKGEFFLIGYADQRMTPVFKLKLSEKELAEKWK